MKITKKEYIEMNWYKFKNLKADAFDSNLKECKHDVDAFLKFHNIQVEDENEEVKKVFQDHSDRIS